MKSKPPGAGSKLDQTCREVVLHVDGAVACALVDLRTGTLRGLHARIRSPALERAMVQAALSMLGHRSAPPGAPHAGTLEAHVVSEHGYHLAKALDGGDLAVMLVTNRNANAALGQVQLSAVIPKVTP